MKAGDETPGESEIPVNFRRRGLLPVSPIEGHSVMDVEGMEAADSEADDDETAPKIDEPPERRGPEQEGRDMRRLADPRLPSQDERNLHNFTHVPYRNWCPILVPHMCPMSRT